MGTIAAHPGAATQQAHQPPAPLAPGLAAAWALDQSIAFLNHGSFGARPRSVLAAQSQMREEFEARPIEWLERRRRPNVAHALSVLGSFIGASPADLGFVTNASDGINAVLRSLTFRPGDELLTTTHAYNAVRQALRHVAARSGARVVEAAVPFPITSPAQVVSAIATALTDHTRLLLIDHVTSPTAMVVPVHDIVRMCAKHRVDVLVDGAHAPGMLPLNAPGTPGVEELAAAYYAGNLHKWVSAPPGAAFLWVRPDRQRGVHPTTVSHFWGQGLSEEFQWQGTRDITPWLCVPAAIEYFAALDWNAVRLHNHRLATWAQTMLCGRLGVEPATPDDGSMLGSMCTVLLPRQDHLRRAFGSIDQLAAALYHQFSIEAPVIDWGGRWWVRVSCQVYNLPDQYQRLADALLELCD